MRLPYFGEAPYSASPSCYRTARDKDRSPVIWKKSEKMVRQQIARRTGRDFEMAPC